MSASRRYLLASSVAVGEPTCASFKVCRWSSLACWARTLRYILPIGQNRFDNIETWSPFKSKRSPICCGVIIRYASSSIFCNNSSSIFYIEFHRTITTYTDELCHENFKYDFVCCYYCTFRPSSVSLVLRRNYRDTEAIITDEQDFRMVLPQKHIVKSVRQ